MTNSQLTQKHSIPQQHNVSVSSRNKKANMNKKFNKSMKQQQPTLKDGNDMFATQMVPNKKQQVKNKKKPHQQTNINSTDIVMNANSHQQHQHQQKQKQKQQHRRNILPVKVRRVERRKDIVSMTDALETSQTDILSSSPPVLSSATESEDSDPSRLNRNRYKKNNSNKKQPSLGNDDTFPPLMSQQQQRQQQTNKKSGPTPRRQRKHQENKVIYAGPTFNNAPAPSCLPIPPPTLNNNSNSSVSQDQSTYHEDVFYMEVVPPRPTYHQPDFQQQSRDLMNLLAPRYAAPPPPPMMTMTPTMNYPPRDHTLSQIQRDLRSILKLEVAS